MAILSWILTGLVIGAIARLLVPGRQPIGLIATVLLGVGGAFLGGYLATMIWGPPVNPAAADVAIWWPGWLMSIVGAVILLWAFAALSQAGRERRPVAVD